MKHTVQLAHGDAQIAACFHTMVQLRSHLTESGFVARIKDQMEEGYHLAFIVNDAGLPVALAGFRIGKNLHMGKHLYVDDLVTDQDHRSHGYGEQLIDWLEIYAIELGCDYLHLDSGVQRFAAHRFYLNQGFNISCHHFDKKLPS